MASTYLHSVVLLLAAVLALGVREQGSDRHDSLGNDAGVPAEGKYFVFVEVFQLNLKGESIDDVGKVGGAAGLLEENASSNGIAEAISKTEAAAQIGLYHTEVTFCDRDTMLPNETELLTAKLKKMSDRKKISKKFWLNASNVSCETLGYGGGDDAENCSGVSHFRKTLSEITAAIDNIYPDDPYKVWKYLYGTTDKKPADVMGAECSDCGRSWAQTAYGPVARNCNFWSKKILQCQLGLDGSLPWLSVSNMRPLLNCKC